ncbi:hypothetical protein DdX_20825 [Ditylenchus destructor]|uniref:Uncharacterized protein n=1 Tax=Ditylenchus destructor TaxID=166010 RepID=A0AAD4MGN1_9BILA|nr:hypothetical protein DdX_20825 [Ditylenchus destructor]
MPQKFDYEKYFDYKGPGFHYDNYVNFKTNVLRRRKRDFGATLALGAGAYMLYKGGKWLKRKVFGPAKSKVKSKAAALKWAESKKAEEEKKKAEEAKAAEGLSTYSYTAYSYNGKFI